MELLWLPVSALSFVIFVWCMCSSNPQMRILNVYTRPGKWYYFKYVLIVALFSIRKFFARFSPKKKLKPGYGIQSHGSPEEMDKQQPLSKDPKAFDAVYMNGSNRIGLHLIIGLARRPTNIDGFLILKVPGVGLLLSPRLPDTVLPSPELDQQREGEGEDGSFSTSGLRLTPIQPMRTWLVQYTGKMRLAQNPLKKFRVVLEARWEADSAFFNYDTDVLVTNIAKALSNEAWSRSYFQRLREHHQSHYEQFGELAGHVVIDDVDFNINISTMRDHSFGVKREWKAFHRYVLHIFTLADGSRGTVGIVCIPTIFSRLEIGYVCGFEGSVDAVSAVDFELYSHGENGIPPTDYGFTFIAGDVCYEVKVQVEEVTELYLGLDWEARLMESMCRYSINGVEGWGVVEWMFAHDGGRPLR